MADLMVKGINTKSGVAKYDYNSLANLPDISDLDAMVVSTSNILNPNKFIEGFFVNKNTGNLVKLDVYNTYAKIPVEASTKYTIQRDDVDSFLITYAWYDSNEKFISAGNVNKSNISEFVITSPSNAAFLTFSYALRNQQISFSWNNLMLSQGEKRQEYVPFKVISDGYNYVLNKRVDDTEEKINSIPTYVDEFSQICYGGEKLYSWYKKLIDGNNVKVTLMGDSTMAETYLTKEHPNQKKAYYIQKMIEDVIGAGRLKLVNWGVGSTCTGDLVGNNFSNETIKSMFPNGYMASRISADTDLLIINYGINDYSSQSDSLTYDERLDVFKANYIEFFERLYNTSDVSGKPSLGRSLDDIAVILMVPSIVTTDDVRKQWAFDCRNVLQELTKSYPFALFDTLKVNSDHSFSSAWSIGDKIHPNYYVNAYTMQYLKRLVIPDLIN